MADDDAVSLLMQAIQEVARSPQSMRKLARAGSTRANLEREWVYEIDGTDALEGKPCRREVYLGNRQHADMELAGRHVEFKSTHSHYANRETLWNASSRIKASAEAWLGPDMDRMAVRGGIFVLLVTTTEVAGSRDAATADLLRREGLSIYRDEFLPRWAQEPSRLVEVSGGVGTYCGIPVVHDIFIVDFAPSARP